MVPPPFLCLRIIGVKEGLRDEGLQIFWPYTENFMFMHHELMFTALEHVFMRLELMFIACEHNFLDWRFPKSKDNLLNLPNHPLQRIS